MRKSKVLNLLAALAALALAGGTALASPFLVPLELDAFDRRLALRAGGSWPADVVMVPIPAGRSREAIAELLRELSARGAKTVALDVAMPDSLPGDEVLAKELSNVVIPIAWIPGWNRERDVPLASIAVESPGRPITREAFVPATRVLASAAAGQGHSLAEVARDGVVRTTKPFVSLAGGGSLPSAPLVALLQQRDAPVANAVFDGMRLRLPTGVSVATAEGDVYLDLDAAAGPLSCDSRSLLEGAACPGMKGALAIVYVDDPNDDRFQARGRFEAGGLLFAAAVRTLDSGRTPRPVGTLLILLLVTPIAIVTARTRRIAAGVLAGFGYGALCLALVPLVDVFLPIAPLAPLLLSGLAGRLASQERFHS